MDNRLPTILRGYRVAMAAASPLAGLLIQRRLKQGKEDPARIGERRGRTSIERPAGPLVWIHGASVGEVLSAAALIEKLRASNMLVLVTSGTVTSAEIIARRFPSGVIHQFLPYDAPRFVERFLDHWRPDLALFIESDLWPNLILTGAGRRLPMILINGRMSPRSFPRWSRAPRTISSLLGCFDLCLAQSPADAERFTALGCPHVTTTGNLKFDVAAPSADPKVLDHLMTMTQGRPVIVAASTHPGEEEIAIDVHKGLVKSFPRLLSIIVPRHPARGEGIARMVASTGLRVALRSRDQLPSADVEIYVADTLGELGLFYRLAPVVIMGASFVPQGGHNPIEPAKLGAAIAHGPYIGNNTEVYEALDSAGGGVMAQDAASLVKICSQWLNDSASRDRAALAARKTVDALGGALNNTLNALEPYLLQLSLESRASNA